jgi:hypothetical protein
LRVTPSTGLVEESLRTRVFSDSFGVLPKPCSFVALSLLLAFALCARGEDVRPACAVERQPAAPHEVASTEALPHPVARPLIVIGFMGGNVRATNLVHKEAQLARDLQKRFPSTLHAAVFANGDKQNALQTVLRLLDEDRDGCLSKDEKATGRIVIYGHSWGASEAITLANRLNALAIPVLLTVQVDSVQKLNENDAVIPPNVHEAINFYQTEGLLHGRQVIKASDPKQTRILGNFASTYREKPVALEGYPWFARTFMKAHIEIENDPAVWDEIEKLIGARVM